MQSRRLGQSEAASKLAHAHASSNRSLASVLRSVASIRQSLRDVSRNRLLESWEATLCPFLLQYTPLLHSHKSRTSV